MRFALLLGLLVLILSGAHASRARASDESSTAPIHFYRVVTPESRVTFFYPSFHLRDARVPRPPMAMLDRIKHLVLEADIVEAKAHPQELARYVLSPKPLDLAKLFTPAEIAGIRSRADCNGVGPLIEKLRLSFIATLIALPCPKPDGGSYPKPDGGSYEEEVERAAQERGLGITGLESVGDELAAMTALPDRLFIEEIKELAVDAEGEDRLIERMIALYNAGDFDALYDLATKSGIKRPADRKLFLEKVLLERNRRMAARLTPVLAEGDALVIIGALHFPGRDGIVDLLKRRGYKVTAITVTNGALD